MGLDYANKSVIEKLNNGKMKTFFRYSFIIFTNNIYYLNYGFISQGLLYVFREHKFLIYNSKNLGCFYGNFQNQFFIIYNINLKCY